METSENGQTAIWVGGFRFVICEDRGGGLQDKFRVRVTPPGGLEESFWLDHPEPSFETEPGCWLAILLFLEERAGTLK